MLKGVAILMMLFLHLFMRTNLADLCQPLLFVGNVPLVHIITRACSPVDFFLIISGYGLSYVYFHGTLTLATQSRRLLKLFISYWIILLVFVSIGHFIKPGLYPGSIEKIILNVTSWNSSYNAVTWFLFPYMLLSLTSIWIFKIMDRIGIVSSFILSMFLYLCSCYIISRYIVPAKAYDTVLAHGLTYLDLLFSFVIGALMHRIVEKRGLNMKMFRENELKNILVLVFLFAIMCFVTTQAFNPIYSLLFTLFFVNLKIEGLVKKFLITMGKHSMPMWMIHTFFSNYLFQNAIFSLRYPLLIFFGLVIISYVVSFPIMRASNFLCKKIGI